MSPVTKPRILIAGDQALVSKEYPGSLEPEFEVIGAVVNEEAIFAAIPELKPDVLVLDASLPWMNELVASKRVKKLARSVRIVYLALDSNDDFVSEALHGGVSGYVQKTDAVTELVDAIREVLRGKKYLSPSIADAIGKSHESDGKSLPSHEKLTDRQRAVLKLLVEGRTMKEIAYVLQLTPRTIAFHKYTMMERLHLRTNAELIKYAISEHVTPGL